MRYEIGYWVMQGLTNLLFLLIRIVVWIRTLFK